MHFIKLPEWWAVCADGINGAVYDNDVKKASIYFNEPIEKSAMLDQSNGMMRKTEFIEKIIIIKWGINIVRKICEAIKSYNVNFMTVREILWF